MPEPHIQKESLYKKINALFAYRSFPWLLEQCAFEAPEEAVSFLHQLTELQAEIYMLDAHLEANWHTSYNILEQHWSSIRHHLGRFGISLHKSAAYLSHIQKYQKHELSLRKRVLPQSFNMSYFYFYKSCDVKLLRRLIYERGDLRKSLGSLNEWRYFDLVTEVNDDVEDLQEDLQFLNGNRFMITLLLDGKMAAQAQFGSFLDTIDLRAKQFFHKGPDNAFRAMILRQTLEQVENTKFMMEQQLDKTLPDILRDAAIMKYLQGKSAD